MRCARRAHGTWVIRRDAGVGLECLVGILAVVALCIATPVGAQTKNGYTALFAAAGDGHTEIVSQLLASGAE